MSAGRRSGSLEGLFEGGGTVQRTLRVVAAALALSLAVHALMWALFASVPPRSRTLVEERPGRPSQPAWVEAAMVDEDDTNDAPVADQVDPGREERAQGAPAGDTTPVDVQTPPPARTDPAPAAPAATAATEPAPAAATMPAPVPRKPRARRSTNTNASASASGTGTAKPDSAAGSPGDDGDSGGPARERAPDLAARFVHDLPRWAAGAPAWESAPPGDTPEITVLLELGADGRLVQPSVQDGGPPPGALLDSVNRARRALVVKLALPGHAVRAGTLRLAVRATVADGAPPTDHFEGDYDPVSRTGTSNFVLPSGRSVTFHVRVLAVEPQ